MQVRNLMRSPVVTVGPGQSLPRGSATSARHGLPIT
jgi:hypothetical protein